MSLDQNLFTLLLTQNKDDPNVVDLVDPNGTIHYRKQRVDGAGGLYSIQLYDFASESLLVTVTAPSANSKTRILELCNPTTTVELKYTGTLSFKWSFKWESHDFEWKREECYLIRKPDPPVLVAITKEPPGKLKTSAVQLLDYNLNRFDIDDRKGLEIVILTALLTFQDENATYHASTPDLSRKSSTPQAIPVTNELPPLPSKPAPRQGVDRIAEMQAMRGEVNEVNVEDEGDVEDYAQYVWNLLQDEALLFVTVRSAAAEQVPKVLAVVEEAKRLRHRAGAAEESELHQYVLYDTVKPQNKGPRRIKLDDDEEKGKGKYVPPNSLIVHLSKISMPELQPRVQHPTPAPPAFNAPPPPRPSSKDKEKDGKRTRKGRSGSPPQSASSNGLKTGFFGRRSKSPNPAAVPSGPKVHSYQVHPHQPSPSVSQLNNPGIYAAPAAQQLFPPQRLARPGSPYDGYTQSMPPPPPPPEQRPLTGFFDLLKR